MTVGVTWPYSSRAYDQGISSVNALPQRILGGTALGVVALACAWTICVNLGGPQANEASATRGDRLAIAGRADKLAVMQAPGLASTNSAAIPFDSRFSAAFTPSLPESTFQLASVEQPDAHRLQPARRLARSVSLPHSALRGERAAAPASANQQTASGDTWSPPADHRNIFERLFSGSSASPSIFAKLFGSPSSDKVELAYASADTDGMTAGTTGGLYDRQTAVYDISAHMVYLPNGTALEAHSGLAGALDDPGSAKERDRGVTPPDVYTLRPREHLFHGVAALRLIPVDENKVFGRSGLLAHTFMLGPNGQSNGCVSFRDYDAFLKAYQNGEISKLAVVAHL
jgi:type VI secretion system (T6SS) effector TldE1-like protein